MTEAEYIAEYNRRANEHNRKSKLRSRIMQMFRDQGCNTQQIAKFLKMEESEVVKEMAIRRKSEQRRKSREASSNSH